VLFQRHGEVMTDSRRSVSFHLKSIRFSTLHRVAADRASAPAPGTRLITLLAVPVATSIALAIHHFYVSQKEPPAASNRESACDEQQ
jgi:hypothetical protein